VKNKPVVYSWKPAHFSLFSAVFPRARAHPLFSKKAFTSSPFPCNLLILSELWVKASFFVVFFQLSDIQ